MSRHPLSLEHRLWIVVGTTLLLFTLLVGRLFNLQVLKATYYDALAAQQRQLTAQLLPDRGIIYTSDETSNELFPLAVNKPALSVYAVPKEITDPARVADELAPALIAFAERKQQRIQDIVRSTGQLRGVNEPPAEKSDEDKKNELDILRHQLYEKLNQKTDPYEPLLRPYETLDAELQQFLETKKFGGVVLQAKSIRFYPEGSLAAHVIGHVGWTDERPTGTYGVEGFFDRELVGNQGVLVAEHDAAGQVIGIGDRSGQAANDGANVVLTIDRVVQSFIEEELRKGVEKYDAEGGSIIVMDPHTGAILGMASYPTYDPNYYSAIRDPHVQVNSVVADLFEPGSIMKPVVMAAAIEEGLIEPDTTMVDNGPVKVAEYTINTFDGRHWGVQTMTQILEQSNNIGMVWVGQKLGAKLLYDYLRRFGLGEKTGVELQSETQSSLPRPADWNVTTVATASFGQGIALTPLQALNAINAIANQGKLLQPYIVKKIQYSDGQEKVTQPTTVHQVISATTSNKVAAMMVSVIENGVAQLARVPGYYLAGKTGTAQVPDDRGKYSPDRKIISFVGFGPVADPKFSILIQLNNPAGLSFASGTAAPMFRTIAEKLLTYYHISPDYDATHTQPPFTVPASSTAPGA